MAGLLDFLDTPDGQLGIGLLAAAGPSMSPMGFGQRLAQGLQYVQEQKQNALRSRYLNAQIDETAAQAQERKVKAQTEAQALELAKARQAALPTLFSGSQSPGMVTAPLVGGVPMYSQGVEVSQPSMSGPKTLNWEAGLRAGFTPEQLLKMAELPNIGRAEVTRTIDGVDEKGRPVTRQFDKFGQPVGAAEVQWKEPKVINQGDRQTLYDPVNRQITGSLGINMSAAERDASARGWASHRLAEQNANSFQWNNDLGTYVNPRTLKTGMPIDAQGNPMQGGGPKLTEDQAKATGWLVQSENAYKNMLRSIKEDPDAMRPGVNDVISKFPLGGESIANLMRGETRQQFMQGSSSLSEALLRAATGAGINAHEAEQKIKELTPQIGDSNAVIQQKMASIPLYIETLKARSGQGAKTAERVMGSEPPESAEGAQSKFVNVGGKQLPARRADDGKFYVQQGGQWYQVKD